ncbi:MAG: hypothetical protein ACR2O3_00850 [Rhizobiaceae bacterium]
MTDWRKRSLGIIDANVRNADKAVIRIVFSNVVYEMRAENDE